MIAPDVLAMQNKAVTCGICSTGFPAKNRHVFRRSHLSLKETIRRRTAKLNSFPVFVKIGRLIRIHVDDLVEDVIFDGLIKNQVHVLCRCVVIDVRKSMGIRKMRIGGTKRCRLFIHHFHKMINRPADVFRNQIGHVIC